MPGWRVGIDIGGTFTDVVGMEIETGKILVTKVPSIPVDPSRAVAAGLQNLMETHPEIKSQDIDFFAHGTTVATNATIEGKGAKSGLLITKGFRAIYDMRGGNRPMGPDLIDTHWQKPVGLVPQKMTHEVGGRLGFDGEELGAARRGRGAAGGACAARAGRAVGRRLLSLLLHQSKTREAHRRDHPRGTPDGTRLAFERRLAADPRISAAVDHGARCLCRPGRRQLSPRDHRPAARDGPHHQEALHHAIEWRVDADRHRHRISEPDAAVRPGRWRCLRRRPRQADRRAQHRHFRCRRHQHRYQRALQEHLSGNAPRPHPRSGYRHADDPDPRARRRRRHHRPYRARRIAERRAAIGRRRSGPGLLRPWRSEPYGHRREYRARLSQSQQFRRRPFQDRPRTRCESDHREDRQALGPDLAAGGARHHPRRLHQYRGRPAACLSSSAASTRACLRCWRSAAAGRCWARASPRISAFRA